MNELPIESDNEPRMSLHEFGDFPEKNAPWDRSGRRKPALFFWMETWYKYLIINLAKDFWDSGLDNFELDFIQGESENWVDCGWRWNF